MPPVTMEIKIGERVLSTLSLRRLPSKGPIAADTELGYRIELTEPGGEVYALDDHRHVYGRGVLPLISEALASLVGENEELGRYPRFRNRARCRRCGDLIESVLKRLYLAALAVELRT